MRVAVVGFDVQVVVGEEIEHVRVITLNRPRQLNAISPELVDPISLTLKIFSLCWVYLLLLLLFFF